MNKEKYTLHYKNETLQLTYFIRPGNDKTLLYLHGGACSSEDFLEATKREELKAYTIIGFDFPGCGESSYAEHETLELDDLIEITRKIIQNFDLHNIILIGHSTGGLVALKYIIKYGDINGFISVEGNLAPENCVFSRKVVESKNFYEFKTKTWLDLQTSLKNNKNQGFQEWAKAQEKASAKAFYDYCRWIVKICDDPNTLNEYLNLKIPHLYIYGSENSENLTFLKKFKAANCKIAEISNSNHFPFYDNPDEFYDVVVKFLATT
jgi:pimeloyl-ACP methyl ester carboxylesterase